MKTTAVLFLACALSANASHHLRRENDDYRNQPDYPSYADLPKYGYNKYGGNAEHPETNPVIKKPAAPATNTKTTTSSSACLPRTQIAPLVDKYIATFSGITDGGAVAKTVFDENFKFYSQSIWWVTSPDVIAKHGAADDFPPVFNNRAELIRGNIKKKNNPSAILKGPVAYGCNSFTFYWKGNFEVPKGNKRGRGNGIDMVFLNPKTGKVTTAYSEYNTLNQVYNWGAHITWAKDRVCCDCPVVFNPKCKCK
ncbi:hypothetical protein NW754_012049 [Fusarium falciforme]|nr:hypothetical protein NW754_012049 [Fusarium falciforme]KAJ4184734.1 hypothetical protein NW767_013164 [Fusarium falciforme]KAJ4245316.1 hypothetical protein NW757_009974 [Fusarium falciforme]